jgi:choline dehydrogenase-like flavoprotein
MSAITSTQADQADCDFIVVGSGAGGGTVAARLAEAGWSVVLLEAGGDPRMLQGADARDPHGKRLPDDYDVPAFHAFASENEAMKWDFFVRHYADDARQRRDPKYRETWNGQPVDGVLYPRAGTLGGCTAHNAMITIYPHNEDWDGIARLTGDASWRADAMRGYFERMENCHHRPLDRFKRMFGFNPSRHGFSGWLSTEKSIPKAAFDDRALVSVLHESAAEAFLKCAMPLERIKWFFEGQADANDWRLVRANSSGIRYTPLATRGHQRMGTRERVLETAREHANLRIELNALATGILWGEGNRAIGIEYLKGERLYRASGLPPATNGERRQLRARHDVILCGGAFNTPQLLMLSGVGPAETLTRFGIPVRVDLPGVGRNLQDRYEVGVVNRMKFDRWHILDGAAFQQGDPQYAEWATRRKGVYATNGAVLAVVKRSVAERPVPDLFVFALLGLFKGYFPTYSALFAQHYNYLTWCVLKAHTNNRGGEVTLRSTDPRDTPAINFHYFDEGTDTTGEDLDSVVDGIKFAREMTKPLIRRGLVEAEEMPGEELRSDDELRQFVKDQAWGHHASCTCAIGPREQQGVLTSDFRVHGTRGLRVVDASIFPRIPGFFIVTSVYMAGEKAADVIGGQAKTGTP